MRSLQIVNGDLVVGRGGYREVTGQAKVAQDLNIATLTPYGSNRFHPGYGSTLGKHIGEPVSAMTVANIKAEVQRLISNYMLVQKAILTAYQQSGYASPYSNADLVAQVVGVNVVAQADTITVDAQVRTLAGQTVPVTTQVTA